MILEARKNLRRPDPSECSTSTTIVIDPRVIQSLVWVVVRLNTRVKDMIAGVIMCHPHG